MKILKGYVRNQRQLEGCIVESYIVEEAIEFCIEYLHDCEVIGILSNRFFDSVDGKGNSNFGDDNVDVVELEQAHLYILHNFEEVTPYVIEHLPYVRRMNVSKSRRDQWIQKEHTCTFIAW